MTDPSTLEKLLLSRSVSFGNFVLSSGLASNYYIDARKTTMSAEGIRLIGALGVELIRSRGWTPTAVGGLTMGADPVAYAIARASLERPPVIDAFSVRKAAKEHGTQRRIEGNFAGGAAVVIVEDVITSGKSALQAIEAVRAEGGSVIGVVAIVDREQGGKSAIESTGLDVAVMTTASKLGLR